MSVKNFVALIGAITVVLLPVALEATDFDSRPEEFVGSIEKQILQLELAEKHQVSLARFAGDIREGRDSGKLVQIADADWHYLDPELGKGYPYRELMYYARPWVADFIECLGRDFHLEFGKRLKVTSLIRTPYRQHQIQGWNNNAQKANPSAHFTGSAVDISKKEMTSDELEWMRRRLHKLVKAEKIVVVEEMYILNFHIYINPDFRCTDSKKKSVSRTPRTYSFPCAMQ